MNSLFKALRLKNFFIFFRSLKTGRKGNPAFRFHKGSSKSFFEQAKKIWSKIHFRKQLTI